MTGREAFAEGFNQAVLEKTAGMRRVMRLVMSTAKHGTPEKLQALKRAYGKWGSRAQRSASPRALGERTLQANMPSFRLVKAQMKKAPHAGKAKLKPLEPIMPLEFTEGIRAAARTYPARRKTELVSAIQSVARRGGQ